MAEDDLPKPEPKEAEFKEVAEVPEKPSKKPGKSVRLINGEG